MSSQLNTIKILIFYFGGNKTHLVTLLYPIWQKIFWDCKISIVALEATFSTSGRIDPYQTNLLVNIIDALFCTQYWVKKSRKPMMDNIIEILKDDEVAKALE
uniref:HAT C-terminal dimerisation domain-containing protein n=1 Tax=Lactuca sativa TaxID=4236 RepID=A0A9R1W122_LACSA|nr:hypothetical protein LSAT_V11C300154560 [Lactuca sativa]